MEIGRVVGSNDQLDYIVQVYGPGDVASPPRQSDRAFGRFVQIPVGADRLIGIVYTTQLLNPSYGTLGPRLSSERELPVFSPDYKKVMWTSTRDGRQPAQLWTADFEPPVEKD